jgi:hypothetical protein
VTSRCNTAVMVLASHHYRGYYCFLRREICLESWSTSLRDRFIFTFHNLHDLGKQNCVLVINVLLSIRQWPWQFIFMLIDWKELCELLGKPIINHASHCLQMVHKLLVGLSLHKHACQIPFIVNLVFLFLKHLTKKD